MPLPHFLFWMSNLSSGVAIILSISPSRNAFTMPVADAITGTSLLISFKDNKRISMPLWPS